MGRENDASPGPEWVASLSGSLRSCPRFLPFAGAAAIPLPMRAFGPPVSVPEGVGFELGAEVEYVAREGTGVSVRFMRGSEVQALHGDRLLVAAGPTA
jgi:hypothetical protein